MRASATPERAPLDADPSSGVPLPDHASCQRRLITIVAMGWMRMALLATMELANSWPIGGSEQQESNGSLEHANTEWVPSTERLPQ